MTSVDLSAHAKDMLKEREIPVEWLNATLLDPERQEVDEQGNIHYYRTIRQHGTRVLHVIVNPKSEPPKVITLFFDRRERRAK